MLIDKTHLGWGTASAVVLTACAAGYVASTSGGREAAGGSVPGLAFGTLALGAMIFAGLLAVRKKFPGLRLGSAQFWLRGHIWLGLLSVPLVLFHSGFRFGGTLERALMYIFFIVIASGVYGFALQQVLPRVLKVRVPLETFPQQIPTLCQKFREDSAKLVDGLKKAAVRRAGPISSTRLPSVAAPPVAKAGAAAAKSVDKEALAAKLAMMKAGAAKPASADSPASKAPTMKGVAAKAVDKGSSVAEKIAAMKNAAAAKAAAAAGSESPAAAPIVEPPAAPVASTPEAEKAATSEKSAKPAIDKDAFMAQLAAKKAGAKAKAEATGNPASPPASAASAPDAPKLTPAAADKPPVGDKAAFMAALAAKKAAAGPANRREKPIGDATPAIAPGIAPADKAKEAPMSMMTRVAETGMPRLSLLLRFYENEVLPFFDADERTASRQRVASENYARMAFANLAAELPSQTLDTIEKLEEMVSERRQFLVQVRIQRWLRNWLLIHVPLSAALFVLAALHLVVALRVVPWS